MNIHAAMHSPLAMLAVGALFGTLLGASDLARPIVISTGIIGAIYVAGRFLLPLVSRRPPATEAAVITTPPQKENKSSCT